MLKWFLFVVFVGAISSILLETLIVNFNVTAGKLGLHG